MRIGIQLLYPTPAMSSADAVLLAKAAEERRFATLWRGEHVVNFPTYTSAYPYASQAEQVGQTAWTLRPDTGFCDSFMQLMLFAAHTCAVSSRERETFRVCHPAARPRPPRSPSGYGSPPHPEPSRSSKLERVRAG